MCEIKIVDMRNANKVTVTGTFDTFAEVLAEGGIDLDFSRAKGVISETRNSLEDGSARLPNLASMKIFIYAKESKGGVTTQEKINLLALLDNAQEEIVDKIDELFEDLHQSILDMPLTTPTKVSPASIKCPLAVDNDLEEGLALQQKLNR